MHWCRRDTPSTDSTARKNGYPTNARRSGGQWAAALRRLHRLGTARSHSWSGRCGCRTEIRFRESIATIHLDVASVFRIIPPFHLTYRSQNTDLGQQWAPSHMPPNAKALDSQLIPQATDTLAGGLCPKQTKLNSCRTACGSQNPHETPRYEQMPRKRPILDLKFLLKRWVIVNKRDPKHVRMKPMRMTMQEVRDLHSRTKGR